MFRDCDTILNRWRRSENTQNQEVELSEKKEFAPMTLTPRNKGLMQRRDFLMWAGVAAVATITCGQSSWADKKTLAKVGFALPKRGNLAREASSLTAGFDLYFCKTMKIMDFIISSK